MDIRVSVQKKFTIIFAKKSVVRAVLQRIFLYSDNNSIYNGFAFLKFPLSFHQQDFAVTILLPMNPVTINT